MKLDKVLVVLLIGAALLVLYDHRKDTQRLEQIRSTADSLARAITDSQAVYDSQRTRDSATIAQAERQIIRLRASYNRTQAATDSLLGTIVPDSGMDTPDSSLLGTVAALRSQIGYERLAARELIDTLQSQRDTAYALVYYWQESQRATYQQAQVYQGLLHDALRAKRPSHLVRGILIGGALVGAVTLLR